MGEIIIYNNDGSFKIYRECVIEEITDKLFKFRSEGRLFCYVLENIQGYSMDEKVLLYLMYQMKER